MQRVIGTGWIVFALCWATAALAQEGTGAAAGAGELNQLAIILGKVAIIVVILESALSALFNWRVYREVVNHRAWKTPVMLLFGLAICWTFQYDIFAQALVAAGATAAVATGNWLTLLVSAMILAGGSSGINTLLKNLGLRNALPDGAEPPKLDMAEAWVSVLVNGAKPGIRYQVAIRDVDGATGPQLAGTIEVSRVRDRFVAAFRSESHRFPNYGGWSVVAGKGYRIEVIDTTVKDAVPKLVFEGSFAPRAIIDFNVSV